MHELSTQDYQLIAGGIRAACPRIAEENREKLTLGAQVGAGLGFAAGLAVAPTALSVVPFVILGHFLGMTAQYGIKFVDLYQKRVATGDRCIVPVVDALWN